MPRSWRTPSMVAVCQPSRLPFAVVREGRRRGFLLRRYSLLRTGVALKVEDGSKRAAEPALLAVLRRIDAISASELDRLAKYSTPEILNTRNEAVGSIRVQLQF